MTDTITLPRATVQQVLKTVEAKGDAWIVLERKAITALKAALEQQAEPVAWTGYDLDGMVEAFSRVIEAHHSSKHPFHNPIDMDAKMALRILRGFIPAMKAYATPPQRPWVGLTDEEIAANRTLRYHFGLNNGPVTRAGIAVVETIEAMLKAKNHG